MCTAVRHKEARGGGSGRGGGDGAGVRRQYDPSKESRTVRLRRRGRGGKHHGHDDEVSTRTTAGHAEEVTREKNIEHSQL